MFDLKSFRRDKKLQQNEIAGMLDVTQGHISLVEAGKRILSDEHLEILKGEFGNIDEYITETLPTTEPTKDPSPLIPLYNLDITAGLHTSLEVIDMPEYIERYIPIVGARQGDICFYVTGDSMQPIYSAGEIILTREVENWREYFGYGNSFVLFLSDDRRILKQINKSEENTRDNVLCVSFNKTYQSEELPKKLISRVFKVIGGQWFDGF